MNSTVEKYPLSWPTHWKRTPPGDRKRSAFGYRNRRPSLAMAIQAMSAELNRLGATDVIVSTNKPLRLDGLPRSDSTEPADGGAAVYFNLDGAPRVLACDKWQTVGENLWAIFKHIESVRGQERWGVGSLDQAFRGYDALPEPKRADWWTVLELDPRAYRDEIEAAYRSLLFKVHPDHGGTSEAFARVRNAYKDALAAVEQRSR